jgi:putative toxin-antitoxin system antitoxin component (TIGR02293 family)
MATTTLKRSHPIATIHQQIERIHSGLSFRAVQNLQKALDVPMEKLASVLGMSRATLHRRKIQGKIDKEESEKLVRYQRLLRKAEDVFGDVAGAREWLTHKQSGLGGAVPIEFAKTEIGAREVENLLGRIEYGVYS